MAKVVVIDDRVTNRNILTRLALSVEEGLQVQSFASPIEALTRLQAQNPPDLIITDYNMPEMDGATFIETLRGQRAFADVPIVVVTVYEDRDFCYRALDAGATDFLLSPVDHLEFRARARNLLTMRRQQKLLAKRAADLEQALMESHGPVFDNPAGRLQAFLDRVPMLVSSVDRFGRLQLVNRAHEELFTQHREDLVGKTLLEAFDEAYATRHAVLDDKVLESGRPLSSPRQEVVVAGGRERDLVSVKLPMLDEAGGGEGGMKVAP
jgi:PAS domain S-box-containing protein